MQLLEVKNDIAKILYSPSEKQLLLSDFILLEDVNQSLICQITEIESSINDNCNIATVRLSLSISKNSNLTTYNGYIPSKDANVIYISPQEIAQLIKSSKTNLYWGKLSSHNDVPIYIGLNFLRDKACIRCDNVDNARLLNANLIYNLQFNKKRTVVFDTNGCFRHIAPASVLTLGRNFKIPLNVQSFRFIEENDLAECSVESRAPIQSILYELEEYVESLDSKFIPFRLFKKVIDEQAQTTPEPPLLIMRNKVLRYEQLGLFAETEEDFKIFNDYLSKSTITTIDCSEAEEKYQNLLLRIITNQINKKCYLIFNANNYNTDKQTISQIYDNNNIRPVITSAYDYKCSAYLKSHCKNSVLFAPVDKRTEDDGYGLFLDKLRQKEFIIYGENTFYMPLILKLEAIDKNIFEKLLDDEIKDDIDKFLLRSSTPKKKEENVIQNATEKEISEIKFEQPAEPTVKRTLKPVNYVMTIPVEPKKPTSEEKPFSEIIKEETDFGELTLTPEAEEATQKEVYDLDKAEPVIISETEKVQEKEETKEPEKELSQTSIADLEGKTEGPVARDINQIYAEEMADIVVKDDKPKIKEKTVLEIIPEKYQLSLDDISDEDILDVSMLNEQTILDTVDETDKKGQEESNPEEKDEVIEIIPDKDQLSIDDIKDEDILDVSMLDIASEGTDAISNSEEKEKETSSTEETETKKNDEQIFFEPEEIKPVSEEIIPDIKFEEPDLSIKNDDVPQINAEAEISEISDKTEAETPVETLNFDEITKIEPSTLQDQDLTFITDIEPQTSIEETSDITFISKPDEEVQTDVSDLSFLTDINPESLFEEPKTEESNEQKPEVTDTEKEQKTSEEADLKFTENFETKKDSEFEDSSNNENNDLTVIIHNENTEAPEELPHNSNFEYIDITEKKSHQNENEEDVTNDDLDFLDEYESQEEEPEENEKEPNILETFIDNEDTQTTEKQVISVDKTAYNARNELKEILNIENISSEKYEFVEKDTVSETQSKEEPEIEPDTVSQIEFKEEEKEEESPNNGFSLEQYINNEKTSEPEPINIESEQEEDNNDFSLEQYFSNAKEETLETPDLYEEMIKSDDKQESAEVNKDNESADIDELQNIGEIELVDTKADVEIISKTPEIPEEFIGLTDDDEAILDRDDILVIDDKNKDIDISELEDTYPEIDASELIENFIEPPSESQQQKEEANVQPAEPEEKEKEKEKEEDNEKIEDYEIITEDQIKALEHANDPVYSFVEDMMPPEETAEENTKNIIPAVEETKSEIKEEAKEVKTQEQPKATSATEEQFLEVVNKIKQKKNEDNPIIPNILNKKEEKPEENDDDKLFAAFNIDESVQVKKDRISADAQSKRRTLQPQNENKDSAQPEARQEIPVYPTQTETKSEGVVNYAVGDWVFHPKYGRGQVESFAQYSNKILFCTILFDNFGRRTLDAKLTGLEKIK